jgi:CDP-glycerol glycerophosphotransferase
MKTAISLYLSGEHKYNTNQNFKNKVNYTRAYVKNKIKDNIILYETMHGASMTGNPYALFLQLLQKEGRTFTHVWVVKKKHDFDMKGYETHPNVVFVERHSAKYMYYLTAAKYLINNVTFPAYFIKKDGQVYINTWHGTPLKTIGKDMKGIISQHKNIQRNFLQSDYLIAPNAYTANILVNSTSISGIYPGKIIEEGYPRIDATFNTDKATFVRDVLSKYVSIDERKKIILYAPTWRESMGETIDSMAELKVIIAKMMEHLPSTHQLILKLHQRTYHFLQEIPEFADMTVPDSVDTNELLAAVDILITDYSSIFFDFYITKKPIILFAYDYNEYIAQRGLYSDLRLLDIPVAFNIETFIETLLSTINQKKTPNYQEMIQKYCYKNLDGTTSARYIDIIFNGNETDYNVYSVQNTKKNIIVYAGGMRNNGLSSSLVNLTNTINYDKFNLIVVEKHRLNAENTKYLKKIHEKTKLIYRENEVNLTIREWVFYVYSLRRYNEKYIKTFNIESLYQREFKRLFGNIKRDVVIEYSGYSIFWAQLFAYSDAKKKIIYLHNDMEEERVKVVNNRMPHQTRFNIIFQLYHRFDVLACVGKKTMEANIKKLQQFFDVNKICHIPNSLDARSIVHKSESFEYADVEIAERNYLLNINESNQSIFGFPAPRKDSIIFLSIGRLSPEKDYLKLIETFKKLFNDRPEYQNKVQLYIIGTGALQTELQRKVDDYGLTDVITFTGHLDNPFPLMRKSHCYISSSNYEGQPMVLLEALVLNKDIIATNIEGNVSVLGEKYGHLVDNSIAGLYGGIVAYLENKFIKRETFDIESYEKLARESFEGICLETSDARTLKERVG